MFYSERYGVGRYFVYQAEDGKRNPRRIGYIIGGGSSWAAAQGLTHLGYFKTKTAAQTAIIDYWKSRA